MSRYYFHLRHAKDDEGRELQSLAEAKCHAVRYCGSLLCAAAERFWDSGELEMTVTDDDGLVLFSLTLLSVDAPAIQPSTARVSV